LVRLVTKALRKNREERYQVIKDMLLDLKSLKEELEFQAKLDRSVAPSKTGEASAAISQSQTLPTEKTHSGTSEIKTAVSTITHSLSAEIKRHKAGTIVVMTALVVATIVGIVALYKFLNRTRPAPQASEKPQVLRTTQLTFSTALDQFPSLSPDGNSVAYCSDQIGGFEIYVKQLTPGGRDIQLTSDGQQNLEPAWSPDGQRIVFGASDFLSNTLWSVSVGGRDFKKIAPDGYDGIYSPDGASIYYSQRGLWQVHVSPTTGEPLGEPFQLASGGPTAISHSTITADGKKIAYSILAISSNLWSIPLSPRSNEALGPEPFTRDTSTRHNLARFSPDGKRIAFNRWRVGTSADIWVAEADGKNLTLANPRGISRPMVAGSLTRQMNPEGMKFTCKASRRPEANGRSQLLAEPSRIRRTEWH
jgi:Tol biopolymer transport system component